MGEPVKRTYRSPLREQAARRTRTQIRGAAAELFVQQGYALTTMRQIAESAEVAERTAYLVFPSKLDLFLEVIRVATVGDDQPIPVAERPEFQSILSEPDGEKAVGLIVSMVANFNERSGALITAAHESAGADGALRDAVVRAERGFARDMGLIALALKAHGALHPDLSVEEATDILLLLVSPQAHQVLRRDRKRSVARYRSIVQKALERALLHEEQTGC
jgi:AcrR family transcriptional regulator